MTLFELFEPLMWMGVLWGMGVVTGLGLGTALASQRFAQQIRRDWE